MSQAELATAMNMTQGLISKVEHGNQGASETLIADIARHLRYPISFFFRHERVQGSDSICFHHRKRASMPAKLLATIEAQMHVTQLNVKSLLEDLEIETSNRFVTLDPGVYDDDPRIVAQELRRIWHLPNGPIPNLVRVIEAAGGVVVYRDFGTKKLDGMSCWARGCPPLFFINSLIPMDRARFTIAHELGHLVMHATPPEFHPEVQANAFALELLAPIAEIGYDLRDLRMAKLPTLKAHWRLSMNALVVAARTTGALPDKRVKSLFVQMSRTGYRTQEPYPLSRENPNLLDKALEVHTHQHGYSYDELADMAGLVADEFMDLYASSADDEPRLRVLS